ncbi:hypothetical protein C8F01DRAFT_1047906 [Mycena amicta]|nr:hypothetical protein C8F01DRAFT_1047906 [Mycena amicta]
MKLSILQWIGYQRKKQAPVVEANLTGKTVVVLGANTGLGLEAAMHFTRMDAGRLILACRSEGRGQAAIEKIKAETKYRNSLELWIVDLADFASVKRFADKFEEEGGRLDILVANAAMIPMNYQGTKDGFEGSLQVANLSTPLVALRLLPMMVNTAKEYGTVPRIVVVSSEAHYWADIDKHVWDGSTGIIETLGSAEYTRKRGMISRYPVTKLLNVFFVRALASRLAPRTIVVNSVNPGLCTTELSREAPWFLRPIGSLIQWLLAFTAEEGSRQLVFAAVGEPTHPENLHGEFIMAGKPMEVSDFVLSEQGKRAEAKLWDEVVDIIGKVDPKVKKIVGAHLDNKA